MRSNGERRGDDVGFGGKKRGRERTVKNIVIKINLNGSFSDVHT